MLVRAQKGAVQAGEEALTQARAQARAQAGVEAGAFLGSFFFPILPSQFLSCDSCRTDF